MDVVVSASDEYQKAQRRPTPAYRHLPQLTVIFAVIDIDQRRIEIELDDICKIQPMLSEITGSFRLIPRNHGNKVATKISPSTDFSYLRKFDGPMFGTTDEP